VAVMGWVVEPDSESRKRTVCPLGQFNSMSRYFPSGAGKVLLSPQSEGMEKGSSLTGFKSAEYSMKAGGAKR